MPFTHLEYLDCLGAIKAKYGPDPTAPQFHFTKQSWAEKPYAGLVADLRQSADSVVDVTDQNEDVSFVYDVCRQDEKFAVQLSVVGPYALLLRTSSKRPKVIGALNECATEMEEVVCDIIQRHGLRLLDSATLSKPVSLQIHYTEPGDTRVYQALFSDVERMPWE